ncbi:MAG: DUF192 domain-containing protein [Deltaproteobacteria bacterium]|nr:DUF192 domain-containing protein [Deltaproteobacteria bacterium]
MRQIFYLVILLLLCSCSPSANNPQINIKLQKADNSLLKEIRAEIVYTRTGRNYGMMYRKQMDENAAMLFLFSNMEPRSFWMKNTYLPLDIVFVDEGKKIVSIAKNTQPLSVQNIPSGKPAKYVLELLGGFCDRHGLKEGDQLVFEIPGNIIIEN